MMVIINSGVSASLRVIPAGVQVYAAPTTVSSDSAETVARFYDANALTNTSASVRKEYSLLTQLVDSVTFSNQSPSVIALADGRVTQVSSGIGYVLATSGSEKMLVPCDVTTLGGQSFSTFVGYATGTVSKVLFDSVAGKLDVAKSTSYFSAQNHTTATYTRNASCWLAAVDLSFLAVATSYSGGWTRQRGGVLIAPQVVAFANHYAPAVGSQIRFAKANGAVVARTIAGLSDAVAATGDARVAVLDSPITDITPCPVAGSWVEQDPTILEFWKTSYVGGAFVWLDQYGAAYAGVFGTSNLSYSRFASGVYRGTTFTNATTEFPAQSSAELFGEGFSGFAKEPVAGDSGAAVLLLHGTSPILLLTWHYAGSGTPFYDGRVPLMVASAKANAGITSEIALPAVAPNPTI